MSVNQTYTDEQVILALLKVKEGVHPMDVAKEMGFHLSTVPSWARRAGLKYEKRNKMRRDWAKILREVGLPVPNEVK